MARNESIIKKESYAAIMDSILFDQCISVKWWDHSKRISPCEELQMWALDALWDIIQSPLAHCTYDIISMIQIQLKFLFTCI